MLLATLLFVFRHLRDCTWMKIPGATTISTQKYFGIFESLNIVLASSTRDRFFLSTTAFCRGVLGAEKLWKILRSSQNSSNDAFWNYPPWPLLIDKIFSDFSFCTCFTYFLNALKASLFYTFFNGCERWCSNFTYAKNFFFVVVVVVSICDITLGLYH